MIKKELSRLVDLFFREYKIQDESDCVDCLRYVEKSLLESQPDKVISHDDVIDEQMATLPLRERKQLVRLLTHSCGELNNDALAIFPSIRIQSEHLLGASERKTRSNKIDLQFISDFMHGYCR